MRGEEEAKVNEIHDKTREVVFGGHWAAEREAGAPYWRRLTETQRDATFT